MACIGMQFGGVYPEVAESGMIGPKLYIPLCCICMDKDADFVLFCGHVVQCRTCADKAESGTYFKCPRCLVRSHFGQNLTY